MTAHSAPHVEDQVIKEEYWAGASLLMFVRARAMVTANNYYLFLSNKTENILNDYQISLGFQPSRARFLSSFSISASDSSISRWMSAISFCNLKFQLNTEYTMNNYNLSTAALA